VLNFSSFLFFLASKSNIMVKLSSNARKRARKKAVKDARAEGLKGSNSKSQKNNVRRLSHPTNDDHDHTNISGTISKTKTKNNKKKQKCSLVNQDNKDEEMNLLAVAAAWAGDNAESSSITDKNAYNSRTKQQQQQQKQQQQQLLLQNHDQTPPVFPSNFPIPKDHFLRDEDPYRESFRVASNTAYEGLVWEGPDEIHENSTRQALTTLDEAGLFRTDVTQPAGLGSRLCPSYVTRCLLGEEGTTYRYLGLRMFAHPWNGKHHHHHNQPHAKSLQKALQSIERLNIGLGEKTQQHLKMLQKQRQQRSPNESLVLRGRSHYNVTLINKMTIHKRLREEPMFGANKYSVGWHADSSLEHYSSIAVYHTLMAASSNTTSAHSNTNKNQTSRNNFVSDSDSWAVALRVTHHAEGPRAKRLGDITVEQSAPPIAVSLPSGSTYYMLDDFNHHHQHAVLAPSSPSTETIRYSSTHRLLRQGHTVQDMLTRCHKVMGDPANEKDMADFRTRHGPKIWRSEQVLLTELENEWLRQFFIQGSDHKDLLWGYWEKPLKQLFQYWQVLEERTLQILTLMQKASKQRCKSNNDCSNNNKCVSSLQDGQEALTVMVQVQGGRKNVSDSVFVPMANLLLERAKSRELWVKRERDSVFQKLSEGCRPILFPVVYGSSKKSKGGSMASSPMPEGSSKYLTDLASHVKLWGHAYDQCQAELLPKNDLLQCAI